MKRLPALLLLLCAAFSAQAQRLRFAVVTDTHIGREHAAENLKAAIRSIDADDSVRFVLLLGDISHDGTPKGHRKAVTIRPNCPPAINSVACPPMRVDKLRSKGVGEQIGRASCRERV